MHYQITELYSANPRRPRDWRFQLAQWLASCESLIGIRRWNDPIVNRTVRVLRGDLADDADEIVLTALRLREGSVVDWAELEARIVTEQPNTEIAAATSLSADVTGVFESLFCDVRGRVRSCPGLVLPIAGERIRRGDVWSLLMLAATTLGPAQVGWIAWYFRTGLARGGRIGSMPGLSTEEKERAKSIRQWVRIMTGSYKPMTTLKALIAAQRAERRAEARNKRRQPMPPAPPMAESVVEQ